MFTIEFGKIYRILLISSVSELFGNSSRIHFFRVDLERESLTKVNIDLGHYIYDEYILLTLSVVRLHLAVIEHTVYSDSWLDFLPIAMIIKI